jgi:hypothetical protein
MGLRVEQAGHVRVREQRLCLADQVRSADRLVEDERLTKLIACLIGVPFGQQRLARAGPRFGF